MIIAEPTGGTSVRSSVAEAILGEAVGVGAGERLTCEALEAVSVRERGVVAYSAAAREAMERSRGVLAAAVERGEAVYGLTTGFGPLVKYRADERSCVQGAGLIAHLGAGFGGYARREVVRATMVLRAHTIGQGFSGIDPSAADALAALIGSGLTPAVPELGSVGASGDLIPLSHVARVLMGEGCVLTGGGAAEGGAALAGAGLAPVELSGRDALALVNGTAFMTAYAALATARASRLVERAERLTGWLYRLLGCRSQALDERLHAARGHPNQSRSAGVIREEAEAFGAYEDTTRPLQEVYSLRCAPQVLGACRDQVEHARGVIEREMNGVSDNPVVWGEAGEAVVLHGGNFQGQQVAFASDSLNAGMVQAAVLAERQLDVLLNPEFTGSTPLLARRPGATSGLAGAQLTATALVAEMRQHGGPCATASIPTNGRNQDVVSMGTMAARHALGQAERLAGVLAITTLGALQLTHLRRTGATPGRVTPAPAWAGEFAGLDSDRALHGEIARLAAAMAA